ncbi:hypothetical protein DB346_16350 [Verrucomicrobia bacterium LW23]|nr:hypothetical protein DB346_16350 [Verrucomicrobia bacterium LW23]
MNSPTGEHSSPKPPPLPPAPAVAAGETPWPELLPPDAVDEFLPPPPPPPPVEREPTEIGAADAASSQDSIDLAIPDFPEPDGAEAFAFPPPPPDAEVVSDASHACDALDEGDATGHQAASAAVDAGRAEEPATGIPADHLRYLPASFAAPPPLPPLPVEAEDKAEDEPLLPEALAVPSYPLPAATEVPEPPAWPEPPPLAAEAEQLSLTLPPLEEAQPDAAAAELAEMPQPGTGESTPPELPPLPPMPEHDVLEAEALPPLPEADAAGEIAVEFPPPPQPPAEDDAQGEGALPPVPAPTGADEPLLDAVKQQGLADDEAARAQEIPALPEQEQGAADDLPPPPPPEAPEFPDFPAPPELEETEEPAPDFVPLPPPPPVAAEDSASASDLPISSSAPAQGPAAAEAPAAPAPVAAAGMEERAAEDLPGDELPLPPLPPLPPPAPDFPEPELPELPDLPDLTNLPQPPAPPPADDQLPPPPPLPAADDSEAQRQADKNVLDALLGEDMPPPPAFPPPGVYGGDAGAADPLAGAHHPDFPFTVAGEPGSAWPPPPPGVYAETSAPETDAPARPPTGVAHGAEPHTGPGGSAAWKRRRFANRTVALRRHQPAYLDTYAPEGAAMRVEEEAAAERAQAAAEEAARKAKPAGPRKRRPLFSWFSLVALPTLLALYVAGIGPAMRSASLQIVSGPSFMDAREDAIEGALTSEKGREFVEQVYAPLVSLSRTTEFTRQALVDYVEWWALYEVGIPTGEPGYVISPYARYSGKIDARGHKRGTLLRCPYTNRIFVLP